jgi:two-component system, sensor histidine kinase PdtaS
MAFASRASGYLEGLFMAPHSTPPPESLLNLAFAVVESSNTPLLLLDGNLVVITASMSFCRAFHVDLAAALGQEIFTLGSGEWDVPQFRALLGATVSGDAAIDAYEMDITVAGGGTRNLVLNARKLDYGTAQPVRLLLAVADVTEIRRSDKQKDDLLREKAVLLQEVQHRVANSLQIIASVLMVSARRVQSEETRGHLHDAHHRVMSIAAVQQQLAMTTLSEVKLAPYLTKLCQSLGASMIYDHKTLKLEAHTDDSSVDATDSVSLGLIVTELVINALKHAFPRHHVGKIVVDYRSDAGDWTLSVSDNGIGMPATPAVKAGLGTSIVEALASRLQAEIHTADANPGTMVSIVHSKIGMTAIA